ncbi:MAG: 2-oxoglutarate dehydrogenase E1 component [Pseudomonadota bacterium]
MKPQDFDTIITESNATYIAEIYARYLDNPQSVDQSWAEFFAQLQDDAQDILAEMRGPSWQPRETRVVGGMDGYDVSQGHAERPRSNGGYAPIAAPQPVSIHSDTVRSAANDAIRALMLIRSYRVRGHLEANLDPLGLTPVAPHPELDPKTYGFTEADMDRPIFIANVLGMETATIRQIMSLVRKTYCGSIGIEFMHIQEPEQKSWIQQRIESIGNQTDFTARGKEAILERLVEAEGFENYLHTKYVGTKRFGIDGGEALIPALEQILKRGSQLGIREVVFGMPHRGRLNVLANVMKKPFQAIFSEFMGNPSKPDDVMGSGDVKYHLGTSADREFDGNVVHLSLTANPSHLEAVNTVVLGKVRAKQAQRKDTNREQVLGILLHGDAAFSGQGLVAETFDLSNLKGYRTGGTIHFVVNNQIGFTTKPSDSRSSPYCSDIAKVVQAPIIHVNGDDPEAVVHAARIATEYRQEFKQDVVIDMFCYRRFGHNESDEPAFTQPKMYDVIGKHPTTKDLYAKQLVTEGLFNEDQVKAFDRKFQSHLDDEFQASESYRPNKADWLEGKWSGMGSSHSDDADWIGQTGVDIDLLQEVGRAISTPPSDYDINRKILRQLATKAKMFESGEGIDWATGEALAFGTLMCEGTPVRLSGQDSQRGTFSQRHAKLVDQTNEEKYTPLNHIRTGQAELEVLNSPLSEAGVLGFEYGITLAEPHALVLWEGQFGDFANGAQVIIDQFIASGEAKWLRMSGLVMLLPHGYEGQGPEHSSARLERYLQLCGENNMQVANCTTPANYYHILRRQIRRAFRKPLILMTPKSLLRHKQCVSSLAEFAAGTTFLPVIAETDKQIADKKVKRVVLCSGKVYYDLIAERENRGITDVAVVRVEQLYPWPAKEVGEQIARYPDADVIWCQEEPENMGSWNFVDRRIEKVLTDIKHKAGRPVYVGRSAAASPATGLLKTHLREQAELVNAALGVK